MCWTATRAFRSARAVPADGRRFCVEELQTVLSAGRARDELVADAVLVVSELLTNAIEARAHFTRLDLALHRDSLRIAVTDDAPGMPRRSRSAADGHVTMRGHGLEIVSQIAERWSVEERIPGKEVWAALAVPVALTMDMATCHQAVRFEPPPTLKLELPALLEIGIEPETADPIPAASTDEADDRGAAVRHRRAT